MTERQPTHPAPSFEELKTIAIQSAGDSPLQLAPQPFTKYLETAEPAINSGEAMYRYYSALAFFAIGGAPRDFIQYIVDTGEPIDIAASRHAIQPEYNVLIEEARWDKFARTILIINDHNRRQMEGPKRKFKRATPYSK